MENFTAIQFRERRDFGRKVTATFEFLKQNFKSLFRSLLYIAGPPALLASIFGSSFYSRFMNISMMAGRNSGDPEAVLASFQTVNFWLEMVGMFLFMLITAVITCSVVINYMDEYQRTKSNQISVDRIWQLVRSTFGSYLLTTLVYVGVLIGLYIGVIIIIMVFALMSTVLAVLGGIAAVIGFIYLVIGFSHLYYVRAFEKKGIIDAIGRCFYLIRGKWWSTAGLLLIISLIQSTVSSVFFIPWYINFIITMMHSMENNSFQDPSMLSQVINNVFLILYFLSSFILYALPLVALAFQYFNLVEIKEATGLMSRIDTIGQAESKPQDEHY